MKFASCGQFFNASGEKIIAAPDFVGTDCSFIYLPIFFIWIFDIIWLGSR